MPPEPIRVLRVIARLNMGGPAIHVANLAAGLQSRGYQTTLVAGSLARGEDSMGFLAERLGVSVVSVPEIQREVSALHDMRSALRVASLIRTERPHVLHTHTAKAGAIARVAAMLAGDARPPVVVHTFHGHVLKGYFGPGRTALFRQVERTLARANDALIAVSPEVRDELVELGVAPRERFAVIRLGIPLAERLADESAADYRRLYGIPREAFVVGWVGRMTGVKSTGAVLEIVRAARDEGVDAVLCMVGDGPDRVRLEQLAHELGIARSCFFVGYQEDVAGYYRLFDAFVLPSVTEGTPVSAIEALASGTPVVANRVGGVPDVVRDGVDGFLVEAGDVRGAGRRLAELAGDPKLRARMGEAGRARVLDRYAVSRLVDDVDRLYRALARREGRRLAPAAGRAAIGPAEERQRRPQQNRKIDLRRAVLDVPDVELDPIGPWERGAPLHLRPAGEPGSDLEPAALVSVVLLDLVAKRRARPDDAHVAAQDVPELRQLVDRRTPENAADARDARVALVDGEPRAELLGPMNHRPQLQELEVGAVLAHSRLPVHHRRSALEPRSNRRRCEQRAREHQARARDDDVQRAVQRVPFALSHVCGVPLRR